MHVRDLIPRVSHHILHNAAAPRERQPLANGPDHLPGLRVVKAERRLARADVEQLLSVAAPVHRRPALAAVVRLEPRQRLSLAAHQVQNPVVPPPVAGPHLQPRQIRPEIPRIDTLHMPVAMILSHRPGARVHQEKPRVAPGNPNLRSVGRVPVDLPKRRVIDMTGAAGVLQVFRALHQPQQVPVPVVKLIPRQNLIPSVPVHIVKPDIHPVPRLVCVLPPPQVQILVVGPEREPAARAVAVPQDQILRLFRLSELARPEHLQRVQIAAHTDVSETPIRPGPGQFGLGRDHPRLPAHHPQPVALNADKILHAVRVQVVYHRTRQPGRCGIGLFPLRRPVKVQTGYPRPVVRPFFENNLLLPRPTKVPVAHRARPVSADVDPLPQRRPRILLRRLRHLSLVRAQPADIRRAAHLRRRHPNPVHPAPHVRPHPHLPGWEPVVIGHERQVSVHVTRQPAALAHGLHVVVVPPVHTVAQIGQHRPRLVLPPVKHEPVVSLNAKIIVAPQVLIAQHQPGTCGNRVRLVVVRLREGIELAHVRLHRIVPPQRLPGHQAPVALVNMLQYLPPPVRHHPVATRLPPPRRRPQAGGPPLKIPLLHTLIRLIGIQHRPHRAPAQIHLRQQNTLLHFTFCIFHFSFSP